MHGIFFFADPDTMIFGFWNFYLSIRILFISED